MFQIITQEYERIKEISNKTSPSKRQIYAELKNPSVYKPVIILIIIFLLQQLSGTYAVIIYSVPIFDELSGGISKIGLILFGIVRFVMSVITAACSKSVGRRVLCIFSGLGMSITMLLLSILLYFASLPNDNIGLKDGIPKENWYVLVILLLYVCSSCLGFIVIPWTLIGELLPISVKGTFSGIMVALAYLQMFAVSKSYPYIQSYIGLQYVFLSFSIFSLIGTIFIYKFLPETLGKSFLEIENYFKRNSAVVNQVFK